MDARCHSPRANFAAVVAVVAGADTACPSMANTTDIRPYFTYASAAERLALSARMIRKLCASRHIRAVKIGRSVRISPQELERFEAGLPAR